MFYLVATLNIGIGRRNIAYIAICVSRKKRVREWGSSFHLDSDLCEDLAR
jgi:hypothetical protein